MDAFLNIYAYLIIAVISFVAPVVIFLLSVFHEGITHLTKQYDEEEKQIKELLKLQIAKQDADFNELVSSSNESLNSNKDNRQKIKNRLNPKRQIRMLFIPLFTSLALVMMSFLVKANCWGIYNRPLFDGIMIASFILFGIAIYVLRNTTWAIIIAKKSIDENKGAISLSSQSNV